MQLEPTAMIQTADQWFRAAHTNTSFDTEQGVVQLDWRRDEITEMPPGDSASRRALAFDPWCRLYQVQPERGQVKRWRWDDRHSPKQANDVFGETRASLGDFAAVSEDAGVLDQPGALVIDDEGILFLAEEGRRRILVYDLSDNRLLRVHVLSGLPISMATDGKRVYYLVADDDDKVTLWELGSRTDPRPVPLPGEHSTPCALVVALNGGLFLLENVGTATASLRSVTDAVETVSVPFATDVVFTEGDIAVVARSPGADFLRIRIRPGEQSQLPQMNARHYDGSGIVLSPFGDVVYWTEKGLAMATLARVKFVPEGQVVSFRLDAQQFQTRWGRLFVDACVPTGTSVRVRCIAVDEMPDAPSLAPSLPANTELIVVNRPDLSPPLPPQELVDNAEPEQVLHRRAVGNETPWHCFEDSEFVTYEAPVIAPPGRYLWLILHLKGKSYVTPKIRGLRVQYPAHDLLRRLPRVFSQQEVAANFLQRFLSMTESGLSDVDLRAQYRHLLLDPMVTPAAVLPWLGSLVGMELDHRWSEQARREVLRNAMWLYRFRGTVVGLKRFIEIYLGVECSIVEHFKVRGLGGAFLGEDDVQTANSVLGAGFRIGGQIGVTETQTLGEGSIQDSITKHAHKFSVMIPLLLEAEQRAVVEHILQVHRPAHTLFDICSVDTGMRIGTGLHLELNSVVGLSSGFGQLQLGNSVLGRTDTLGRAATGTTVGNSRLGANTRIA